MTEFHDATDVPNGGCDGDSDASTDFKPECQLVDTRVRAVSKSKQFMWLVD